MTQLSKIGRTATKVYGNAEAGNVFYHSTAIVQWYPDKIILISGGWRTAITKLRMNQTAKQFDLGFRVYQVKHAWYVQDAQGDVVLFQDYMQLTREYLK